MKHTKLMKARTIFSLSANEVGGEGRGEVARLNSNPLAPALSPLRRGEGVADGVRARPANLRSGSMSCPMQFDFALFAPFCG